MKSERRYRTHIAPGVLAVASWLLVPLAPAAMLQSAGYPDSPAGRLAADLISAYNTGSPDNLGVFADSTYPPDRAEQGAEYWSAVYRELGPLDLRVVSEGPQGAGGREVFWHRGRITGAWAGIELRLDPEDPARIARTGVYRGVRPSMIPLEDPVAEADVADSIGAFLAASAAADHFSGVVVVARNGATIFQGAFGYASRARGTANTLDTPLRLASVTKMFTGIAIAQLAERGCLRIS